MSSGLVGGVRAPAALRAAEAYKDETKGVIGSPTSPTT